MGHTEYCKVEEFAQNLIKEFKPMVESKNEISRDIAKTVVEIIKIHLQFAWLEREKEIQREADFFTTEVGVV